jgi:hypothetical protein
MYGKEQSKNKEKYDDSYDPDSYDPDRVYYLQSGKSISGTVYADEPENAPGLGWVL